MEKNIDQYPHFSLLTEQQIETLFQSSSVFKCSPKDVIFRQNARVAHILYIKSGFVKTYKESLPDTTMLIKFFSPKVFLGLSTHFGGDVYEYSASALEATEILTIDAAVFKALLAENHEFNLSIIKEISQEALQIIQKLMCHTHKHLPGRIADALLYFSEDLYKSPKFTLPVTRKELAEFAGASTEGLTRILTEFKNDKIIDIDGAIITINSLDIIHMLSANG